MFRSFGSIIKITLSLTLTFWFSSLPIVGDVSNLLGSGPAASLIALTILLLFFWIFVGKLWEFLTFAFGGGIGRYNPTKLYRRVQWLTFALIMTLPVFALVVSFMAASPAGERSETYQAAVARIESQRRNEALGDRYNRFRAEVTRREERIAQAQSQRRFLISQAERERSERIEVARSSIEAELSQTRDISRSALLDRERENEARFRAFFAANPLAHNGNEVFRREIAAFASALERQFGVQLNAVERRTLAGIITNELETFERVYINSDCVKLARAGDISALKDLGLFDLCSAYVVWLNFEANDLLDASDNPLNVPSVLGLSLQLRELPDLFDERAAIETERIEIEREFSNEVAAIDVSEPPVDMSAFPAIDTADFPEVRLEQFPLRISNATIIVDSPDPYGERVSATFLAHWWWLALLSFGIWLGVQFSSQTQIAYVYGRIIRFLDEGRFGFGGSARFTSMFEEWGQPYETGQLYMGRSMYNPYDEVGLGGEAHMITVAGSRGGKGASAIIPNLLLWEGSCIVVDPKGTNARVTAEARRKMGQKVYLIDPLGIVTNDGDSFDPLAELDPNSDSIRERIGSIADALVIRDENTKDPHWDDGARTIIAGLISHVLSGQSGGEVKLSTVRDLIKRLPEDQDRMWAEMAFNEGAGGYAKDAAMRYIRGSETNEMLGIMSNADKHTEWLSSKAMRKVTSQASFKLSDLKNEPTTVYLIIPPRELTRQNRIIRLFVNLMLDAMEDGGRADVPVMMMIDEFLALDYMPEIPTAFATMASYNLVLWLFIQDLKGLQKKYENEFNAFIANARAVQVFSTTDDVTKEYVSKRLGNRPMSGLASITRASETVPLRSPDDVEKDLKASELRQYVIEAGNPAMLLERVPYFKPNTRFVGTYDPDPDFVR